MIPAHAPLVEGAVTAPPGSHHGLDRPRLYKLIRQRRSVEDRLIEVAFPEGATEAYHFTFG